MCMSTRRWNMPEDWIIFFRWRQKEIMHKTKEWGWNDVCAKLRSLVRGRRLICRMRFFFLHVVATKHDRALNWSEKFSFNKEMHGICSAKEEESGWPPFQNSDQYERPWSWNRQQQLNPSRCPFCLVHNEKCSKKLFFLHTFFFWNLDIFKQKQSKSARKYSSLGDGGGRVKI